MTEENEHYLVNCEAKEDTFTVSICPYHVEDHLLTLDILIRWLQEHRREVS